MTHLLATTLTLYADVGNPALPQWTGHLAREWLLTQMPDGLQADLTESDRRPYTISGLMRDADDATRFRLRLTTLTAPMADWLGAWLPTLDGQTVEIGAYRFHLLPGVEIERATELEIVARRTLSPVLSRTFRLHFQSPTAFRRDGVTTALPTPEAVFGSLLAQWNAFNTDVQLHPDAARFAAECVSVRRHSLRERKLFFEGSQYPPETGTIGECEYVIARGDRYWWGVLAALADYARFAGVGIRTAVGMGRVKWIRAKGEQE